MDHPAARLQPLNIVARRLRVPVRWLRSEAEAGRVPCLRAGSAILCDPEAVVAVLLERARQTGGAESSRLAPTAGEGGRP